MLVSAITTDFWNWAVRAYAGPGVADLCLKLQDDHEQCVPLLLWAAWLAGQGRRVDAETAAEASAVARGWSETAISPLRQLRRQLKLAATGMFDAQRLALREQVKAVELHAEMHLMGALAALAARESAPVEADHCALAIANLQTVCTAWGMEMPRTLLEDLVEALSEGEFLRYNGGVEDR